MSVDVSVIIGTYGDKEHWRPLAERAVASVEAQTVPVRDVVWNHGKSLAESRNVPALESDSEWLVFLDADDELDPEYMNYAFEDTSEVRQPSTLGVVDGVEDDSSVLIAPGATLLERNHIVVGAVVNRDLFKSVGGFDSLPVLEDWDLWIRCWLAGATFGQVPKAIYRVHVMSGSRNSNSSLHGRTYSQIRAKYMPLARQRGLL